MTCYRKSLYQTGKTMNEIETDQIVAYLRGAGKAGNGSASLIMAAEVIERLTSEHRMLLTEGRGEWISVDDRLPEVYTWVLAHAPGYYGKYWIMEYAALGNGKPQFWADETSPTSTVTHWMPLPEPPTVSGTRDA